MTLTEEAESQSDLPATDSSSFWRYSLLATGLVYRLVVALRPLKWLDGVAIPDDTYLSFTIARNLARGLGPLFGTELTNGFHLSGCSCSPPCSF